MAGTPRISGLALRSLARLARSKLGGLALQRVLRAELKIDALDALPEAARGAVPLDTRPLQGRPPRTPEDAKLAPPQAAWAGTSDAFVLAYREGRLTPTEVVTRALAAARSLAAERPSVGPILDFADAAALAEAAEATERYAKKVPRGPLDGVPFAVKECTAVRGMPRRAGTTFVSGAPCPADATCIARLRALGAIVIGTTMMTEYGMTPTGVNPKRTMPRNPHATDCIAGGSSTGSGVAVATGLVPFAIGADGGGSIRVPSSLNGVFGIKPTWGRITREGDVSRGSVAHVGPLASSALDLARVLEATGARDEADPETWGAPPIAQGSLLRALGRGVRGLTVGIEEGEWRDANDEVARAGQEALRALEKDGARLLTVSLPLARFAPPIGYVSIAIEARAGLRSEWKEHADDMSDDLQISFAALNAFTALEYVDAQRLRTGLRQELAAMFGAVDLLAIPSTACTAARVTRAEMDGGFLDAKLLDALCRYAFLGNLSGLPAASAPIGKDARGLPIGLQLLGDAWDEATVLAAIAQLERTGVARVERPRVSVNVL